MTTTRIAALALTLTLTLTLPCMGLAHAEVNYESRYRFITGFYTEMLVCNHNSQNAFTLQFMSRLKAKIDTYAATHGIDETTVKKIEAFNVERVNNQIATGQLDGPSCYRTNELLSGKMKDPVFWEEK